MSRARLVIDRVRSRPLTILLTSLGLALFLGFFLRTEDTRTTVRRIERHQIVVEARTPCVGLTVHRCARLLLASLSPTERRRLTGITDAAISRAVRRQARRLGVKLVPGSSGSPGSRGGGPRGGGGPSPSPNPRPPRSPGGGGGGGDGGIDVGPIHIPLPRAPRLPHPPPLPCVHAPLTPHCLVDRR